jgi:hypothetical protein
MGGRVVVLFFGDAAIGEQPIGEASLRRSWVSGRSVTRSWRTVAHIR